MQANRAYIHDLEKSHSPVINQTQQDKMFFSFLNQFKIEFLAQYIDLLVRQNHTFLVILRLIPMNFGLSPICQQITFL